jgi:hypothetical protein
LFILSYIIFKVILFDDCHLYTNQGVFVGPWSPRVPGPFRRVNLPCRLHPWPHRCPSQGFPLLGCSLVPWLLCAPSSSLVLPFLFNFLLTHSGNLVFAGWSLPTPETTCCRFSSSAGMLELLAPCSSMPELQVAKKEILEVSAGRCPTTGVSLPLADPSTTGLPMAPAPHYSALKPPTPCLGAYTLVHRYTPIRESWHVFLVLMSFLLLRVSIQRGTKCHCHWSPIWMEGMNSTVCCLACTGLIV